MKKRKVFAAALLAVVLAATSVAPTFAYEDGYAEDGDIQWRFSEDYYHGVYTLPTGINKTTSTLTLFIVTEDAWFIDDWSILYEFWGKMNLEDNDFCDYYGFEVNVGLPVNHSVTSTIDLGYLRGNVRQMQVGIYPGYYNFYNYGYNAVNRANSSQWRAITLGPNWRINEDMDYKHYDTLPEDAFVEVQEGENKRVYVLVGEVDFIESAQEDFENWAIETEAHYIEEAAANGNHEETEVEVPEESPENLLQSAAPEVEVEGEVKEPEVKEPEAPVPTEVQDTPEAEEEGGSVSPGKVVALVLVVIMAPVLLVVIAKVSGKRREDRS